MGEAIGSGQRVGQPGNRLDSGRGGGLVGGRTVPESVGRHEEEGELQDELDGDDGPEPAGGVRHQEVAELLGVPLCVCGGGWWW